MPLYVIRCAAGGEVEVLSKEPPKTCPKCGGEVHEGGCEITVSAHARTPGKWGSAGCDGSSCRAK